uniref:Putative nuclease HARBI1 n=1 Tax=Tanacetum cinerariifolium TaxID=118510 RepID=A0A6L2M1P5_TANCI|nr:putative nuclease HARBI1 [Tanacetum cinerariifolium]
MLLMRRNMGFPGLLGSIDCMACSWANFPSAYYAQYCRSNRGSHPFILLEVVTPQETDEFDMNSLVDWANPEGDQVRIDVSKPLPLSGPPGHVTIQTQFFLNHDLDYLRYGSKGTVLFPKVEMDSIISLGQKNTLVEYMILSGADNRRPMLDKDLERCDQNKKYAELSAAKKIQVIVIRKLQISFFKERECKLYDAFNKFTHIKGESLHAYYLRFTQLINDMNVYKMNMEQFQVNTKFLNSLPPKWMQTSSAGASLLLSSRNLSSLAVGKYSGSGILSLFWSTAWIETTDEGTKILATVDGKLMTISESSIRRNLKLNDEEGISTLPDAKLFENLALMGYDILPNQKFTFQKGNTPKELHGQIDVHVAREMEEQMARKDQRRNEQIARDAEIARIHAEEELHVMINGLDRNNEVIAWNLHEYEQAAAELTIGEKIELINELVKYQDHHSKILKYQAQQSKPLSKKQQKEFYMSVLKSHSGWKTKHFKGMALEEIREKFIPVWKQIEDFMPMASKEEGERFKKKGLRLEQVSAKKMKTSEEVTEEDLKEMMQLVPVEEVYVEAL